MNNYLAQARDLLEDITPLATDCGRVCDGRCCHPSEQATGMRLFPGEEEMAVAAGFRVVPTEDGGALLECDGTCDRTSRPLACRMFPLFPYVEEGGRVRAVYDPRAWHLCPLVRECAHVPLRREFVRAVRRAGRLLMANPACAAFLQQQSREIDMLWQLLPLNEERPPIARRRP